MPEPPKNMQSTAKVGTTASERAQAPTKTISSRSLSRAVNRAAELTDWNNHTEARRTFAKAFKYDDLNERYKALDRDHRSLGHLSKELYERRTAIDDDLFGRIRSEYGEETLRRVYQGL